MTGLKSGSGDDLWDEEESEDDQDEDTTDTSTTEEAASNSTEERDSTEESAGSANYAETEQATSSAETSEDRSSENELTGGKGTVSGTSRNESQPYIIRRAVQDKSVQFEREERLTFFVHDDVVDGERELVSELESALGRDVPKFDIREAVYRAALQNREDVLDELLQMGYTIEE